MESSSVGVQVPAADGLRLLLSRIPDRPADVLRSAVWPSPDDMPGTTLSGCQAPADLLIDGMP